MAPDSVPPPDPDPGACPARATADASPASDEPLARHARLVRALRAGLAVNGEPPLLLSTHLSSVIVTRTDAYKLKKPVSLGFVDFSDPAVRRAACIEELRLNQRLAPALYRGVVPVDASARQPRFGAPIAEPASAPPGPLEYAVWMRAFPQAALWAHRVPAGEVDAADAAALGRTIGLFHRDGAPACIGSPHGRASAVRQRIRDNFAALRAPPMAADALMLEQLERLERAAEERFVRLAATLDARDRDGFVRDCHGDLHLANIVTIEGQAVPFDCLEFDAALRTIDVADEIAFTMMDLQHAHRPDLAFAFLDGWLEITGDLGAVPLLDHYRAYRAMVRAKVAAIGAVQAGSSGPGPVCAGYLQCAEAFTVRDARPVLVAMHGLSGSGKSVLSAVLAGAIGAVRLRSDIERKRRLGVPSHDRSGAHGALYAPAARDAVYAQLAALARPLLEAGWPVVIDASFLSRAQRGRFRELADAAGADFVIAELQVPESVLRARLAARAAQGTDASDADQAVLETQLRDREPLDPDECTHAFVHRADDPTGHGPVEAAWRAFRGDRGDRGDRADRADRAGRSGATATRTGPPSTMTRAP